MSFAVFTPYVSERVFGRLRSNLKAEVDSVTEYVNLTPVGTGARMVASYTKVKAVSASSEKVGTVPSRKLQISALLALLSIAFLILRGIDLDEKRHDERIKILERKLLEEFYLSKPGLAVTSEWLAFDLNVTASDGGGAVNSVGFNTHYLKAKSTAGGVYYSLFEKPSLLLLHGYGTTSSLSWRNVLPSLAGLQHVGGYTRVRSIKHRL